MSGRLLTSDPMTRKQNVWHEGHHGDVAVEARQDIEPILEANAENRKERRGFDGDWMEHVARIPLVVYEELMRKGIADDPKALKKWLNKPENKIFRTNTGRV